VAKPLPDDTVVIRGGENKLTDVKLRAEEEAQTGDEGYVLSGNGDPSMDFDAITRIARRPNPMVSRTTVGRLRAAGCEVTPPTGKKRHVTIVLPQPPTTSDYRRFVDAFDPAEPNPHRGKSTR
jgi:hypothetical protein